MPGFMFFFSLSVSSIVNNTVTFQKHKRDDCWIFPFAITQENSIVQF